MGYSKSESLVLGQPTRQAIRNLIQGPGFLTRRDLYNRLRSRRDLEETLKAMVADGEIEAKRERVEGRPGNPAMVYRLKGANESRKRGRQTQ